VDKLLNWEVSLRNENKPFVWV